MSRSTQYIGLTQAALDFVAQCSLLPSEFCTYGMFDEEVPLRRWAMHPVFQKDFGDNREMFINEVVQETPWSSGPMIFTCLEFDWGNGGKALAFEWVHDPRLSGSYNDGFGTEYDREKWAMWV